MHKKVSLSIALALALIAMQAGAALAAPASQETTTIEGTVQAIEIQYDPDTGEATGVLVTLLDADGVSQEATLTMEEAQAQGLVQQDAATGEWSVIEEAICLEGEADCATIVVEGETPTEEVTHPVATALAAFFGVDAGEIMTVHDEGVGFGVIAHALWIAYQIGDPGLFGDVVDAKKTGDYSAILLEDGSPVTLPDGSTPTNWGQFRKALKALGVLEKGHHLGSIMSGKAEPLSETSDTSTTTTSSSNTNQHGKGHNKGNHGNGKAKGHDK